MCIVSYFFVYFLYVCFVSFCFVFFFVWPFFTSPLTIQHKLSHQFAFNILVFHFYFPIQIIPLFFLTKRPLNANIPDCLLAQWQSVSQDEQAAKRIVLVLDLLYNCQNAKRIWRIQFFEQKLGTVLCSATSGSISLYADMNLRTCILGHAENHAFLTPLELVRIST